MRRVRGGRAEEVEKPIVISDYTEHIGAVDRADHNRNGLVQLNLAQTDSKKKTTIVPLTLLLARH